MFVSYYQTETAVRSMGIPRGISYDVLHLHLHLKRISVLLMYETINVIKFIY